MLSQQGRWPFLIRPSACTHWVAYPPERAKRKRPTPARSGQSRLLLSPDLTMSAENQNPVPNQKEIEKLAKYVHYT